MLKCGPMMLIMSAGILAFNTICGGRYSFIAIDVVVALISGFYISGKISGEKNNYNKLEEAFDYMEQLSFACIRNGQVAEALNETAALFTEGKMHDTLNEAITLLDEEYDMTGRRKALDGRMTDAARGACNECDHIFFASGYSALALRRTLWYNDTINQERM